MYIQDERGVQFVCAEDSGRDNICFCYQIFNLLNAKYVDNNNRLKIQSSVHWQADAQVFKYWVQPHLGHH